MRKLTSILILASLALGACGSAPTALAEPEPTAVQQIADQPSASPTDAPAESVSGEAEGASGVLVYKIVPGESTVSYEVGETFFNQNNKFAVAVGVTTEINGEVQVDETNPQNSTIGVVSIDISQFKSDSNRRDNAIQDRFLESARYPIATFTPTNIEGLPGAYSEGQELSFKVSGDLTVREVTKPVTFDVTAKLEGGALMGTATTTILLSDFEVGPIEIAGILGTEDEAKLTLTFVARP